MPTYFSEHQRQKVWYFLKMTHMSPSVLSSVRSVCSVLYSSLPLSLSERVAGMLVDSDVFEGKIQI